MSSESDCLFCKIVAGAIPSTGVFEDELVVAFRDIVPVAPTHVLIVPRRHIVDASTIERGDQPELIAMFLAAKVIARNEGIDENGYRLAFNVGDDAGNSVAHLHLHLLGGRFLAWPPG
ncbi:MAG TPA: histidine triad nucleotide-binding protein [Acidimicrobiales bacterium]|nr:histidine triad nucleotide-binding protein [Acidimicrobiales bacterium]